mgnify:CR=1 FL=1|jgi:hypothetical protein
MAEELRHKKLDNELIIRILKFMTNLTQVCWMDEDKWKIMLGTLVKAYMPMVSTMCQHQM